MGVSIPLPSYVNLDSVILGAFSIPLPSAVELGLPESSVIGLPLAVPLEVPTLPESEVTLSTTSPIPETGNHLGALMSDLELGNSFAPVLPEPISSITSIRPAENPVSQLLSGLATEVSLSTNIEELLSAVTPSASLPGLFSGLMSGVGLENGPQPSLKELSQTVVSPNVEVGLPNLAKISIPVPVGNVVPISAKIHGTNSTELSLSLPTIKSSSTIGNLIPDLLSSLGIEGGLPSSTLQTSTAAPESGAIIENLGSIPPALNLDLSNLAPTNLATTLPIALPSSVEEVVNSLLSETEGPSSIEIPVEFSPAQSIPSFSRAFPNALSNLLPGLGIGAMASTTKTVRPATSITGSGSSQDLLSGLVLAVGSSSETLLPTELPTHGPVPTPSSNIGNLLPEQFSGFGLLSRIPSVSLALPSDIINLNIVEALASDSLLNPPLPPPPEFGSLFPSFSSIEIPDELASNLPLAFPFPEVSVPNIEFPGALSPISIDGLTSGLLSEVVGPFAHPTPSPVPSINNPEFLWGLMSDAHTAVGALSIMKSEMPAPTKSGVDVSNVASALLPTETICIDPDTTVTEPTPSGPNIFGGLSGLLSNLTFSTLLGLEPSLLSIPGTTVDGDILSNFIPESKVPTTLLLESSTRNYNLEGILGGRFSSMTIPTVGFPAMDSQAPTLSMPEEIPPLGGLLTTNLENLVSSITALAGAEFLSNLLSKNELEGTPTLPLGALSSIMSENVIETLSVVLPDIENPITTNLPVEPPSTAGTNTEGNLFSLLISDLGVEGFPTIAPATPLSAPEVNFFGSLVSYLTPGFTSEDPLLPSITALQLSTASALARDSLNEFLSKVGVESSPEVPGLPELTAIGTHIVGSLAGSLLPGVPSIASPTLVPSMLQPGIPGSSVNIENLGVPLSKLLSPLFTVPVPSPTPAESFVSLVDNIISDISVEISTTSPAVPVQSDFVSLPGETLSVPDLPSILQSNLPSPTPGADIVDDFLSELGLSYTNIGIPTTTGPQPSPIRTGNAEEFLNQLGSGMHGGLLSITASIPSPSDLGVTLNQGILSHLSSGFRENRQVTLAPVMSLSLSIELLKPTSPSAESLLGLMSVLLPSLEQLPPNPIETPLSSPRSEEFVSLLPGLQSLTILVRPAITSETPQSMPLEPTPSNLLDILLSQIGLNEEGSHMLKLVTLAVLTPELPVPVPTAESHSLSLKLPPILDIPAPIISFPTDLPTDIVEGLLSGLSVSGAPSEPVPSPPGTETHYTPASRSVGRSVIKLPIGYPSFFAHFCANLRHFNEKKPAATRCLCELRLT